MREGRFREDLFFRLRVIPVEVPPLRERPEDIPVLLSMYVEYYAKAYQLAEVSFSEAARLRLETYTWPGNIRELENCVRYLTCLQLRHAVEPADLPLLDISERDVSLEQSGLTEQSFREAKRELVNQFERTYVEDALRRSNGNITRAALASKKARRAFFELMKKHHVNPGDFVIDVTALEAGIGNDAKVASASAASTS